MAEKNNTKDSKVKAFLKRKNIEISWKRYAIDALGAMAQGLFCSLLVGTIIDTIGTQFGIAALTNTVATVGGVDYTVGGLAKAMSGPAMAVAIGYALQADPMVLFSLAAVGYAANSLGGHPRKVHLFCDTPGDSTIGHGLPVWDRQQNIPHRFAEGRGGHPKRRDEIGCHAAEIDVEPTACLHENSKVLPLLAHCANGVGKVLLPVEPKDGEHRAVGGQRNAAKWGSVMCHKATHFSNHSNPKL